ncbi:MAG: hypothetical protein R3C49_16175 [Planctomycetaceae bacterium]
MKPVSDLSGHEIVGCRLVGAMPSSVLVEMWLKITSRIVKYGFPIHYQDLEAPRTGTFNGLNITLDPDVGFEMQCFILLHLFGHSVQWVAPELAAGLDDLLHTKDRERFMQVLRAYEFQAARIGMALLHEVGVTELDQWYSDFVETDWRYVARYYREGSIPDWETCKADGCEIIQPMQIPELHHKEVQVRFAF